MEECEGWKDILENFKNHFLKEIEHYHLLVEMIDCNSDIVKSIFELYE